MRHEVIEARREGKTSVYTFKRENGKMYVREIQETLQHFKVGDVIDNNYEVVERKGESK